MNNKKIDIRQIEKEVDQNIDLDILYETISRSKMTRKQFRT